MKWFFRKKKKIDTATAYKNYIDFYIMAQTKCCGMPKELNELRQLAICRAAEHGVDDIRFKELHHEWRTKNEEYKIRINHENNPHHPDTTHS